MKRGCLLQGLIAVVTIVALAVLLIVGFGAIDGKSPDRVFREIGQIGIVEYFARQFQPVEIAPQAQVGGIYCFTIDGGTDEGGAVISRQTWAYVFLNDGNFETYLEGNEQFGGTWSQSGNTLTVNVEAIPDLSEAYTWTGNVSSDGRTIDVGEYVMEYSEVICVSE
jgi:hypothetical protein